MARIVARPRHLEGGAIVGLNCDLETGDRGQRPPVPRTALVRQAVCLLHTAAQVPSGYTQ